MRVPQSSTGVAFSISTCLCLALFSYLLNRSFFGHRLRIGHLSVSSANDIRYEATIGGDTYSFTFTASSLSWSLHLPRRSQPRWLTLTCDSIYYTSTTGDISTARLEIVLWFFPVLYKQTAGPWANVTLDELRIRVHRSPQTPYYIQRLRHNLVGTILAGEILRADTVRTTVRFAGLSERPEDTRYDSPDLAQVSEDSDGEDPSAYDSDEHADEHGGQVSCESRESGCKTKPLRARDDDELRVSALVRQLHINNREGRIYTFDCVDMQYRRNWIADCGSLTLVAEECRWVHIPFPFECVAPRSWWTQLFSSFFHFPIDLVRTFNYPASSINLYVTRSDVTFDTFRLRDAELLKQGFSLIREKAITSGIDWSDVFIDALTQAVAL